MASSSEELVVDNYKLLNCLASGQHSQVWEVAENNAPRRLAMKLLLSEAFKDREQRNVLKHEAEVGATLNHPNLLKYNAAVIGKKYAYFTMELFAAVHLKLQIYNDLNSVHVRVKRLIESVGLALEHIHGAGWLHRDVKPENILLTKGSEVKLIDFSLSSKIPSGLMKMLGGKTKTIQGTRTYMAPEQIMGKTLSPQTDIYSFGVSIFEALTGQAPFKGSSPKDLLLRHINETAPAVSEFNRNVTPEMDRLVAKMLMKKPDQRFGSIGEFLSEFRRTSIFKEPVVETVKVKEEDVADVPMTMEEKLDSRADARRSAKKAAGGPAPAAAAAPPAVPPPAAAPAPAAAAPAPKPAAPAPAANAPGPNAPASNAPAGTAAPAARPGAAPPGARPPAGAVPTGPPGARPPGPGAPPGARPPTGAAPAGAPPAARPPGAPGPGQPGTRPGAPVPAGAPQGARPPVQPAAPGQPGAPGPARPPLPGGAPPQARPPQGAPGGPAAGPGAAPPRPGVAPPAGPRPPAPAGAPQGQMPPRPGGPVPPAGARPPAGPPRPGGPPVPGAPAPGPAGRPPVPPSPGAGPRPAGPPQGATPPRPAATPPKPPAAPPKPNAAGGGNLPLPDQLPPIT